MKRVYVAGPIGANDDGRMGRVAAAIHAAKALLTAGVCPVVPHFWCLVGGADEMLTYEQWMTHGFALLDGCHGLLRVPGHSPGSDREVARAKERGLPVFFSVEEAIAWASGGAQLPVRTVELLAMFNPGLRVEPAKVNPDPYGIEERKRRRRG